MTGAEIYKKGMAPCSARKEGRAIKQTKNKQTPNHGAISKGHRSTGRAPSGENSDNLRNKIKSYWIIIQIK